ncbi:MAG: hypothetical protein ACRDHJ_06755 [Actinomycetota bacterium]
MDERSRHQLHRKVEELMRSREATTLMELLPPVGWADVATKHDLQHAVEMLRLEMQALRHELRADMERMFRRTIMWTSSMMVALTGLAFAAGRLV